MDFLVPNWRRKPRAAEAAMIEFPDQIICSKGEAATIKAIPPLADGP